MEPNETTQTNAADENNQGPVPNKFFNFFGGRKFFGTLLFVALVILKAFGIMPATSEDLWLIAAALAAFVLPEAGRDIVLAAKSLKIPSVEIAAGTLKPVTGVQIEGASDEIAVSNTDLN